MIDRNLYSACRTSLAGVKHADVAQLSPLITTNCDYNRHL